MADDKKKEDQGGEGKKKKGLPAIVMIAIGAIVGGAGVVLACELNAALSNDFLEGFFEAWFVKRNYS